MQVKKGTYWPKDVPVSKSTPFSWLWLSSTLYRPQQIRVDSHKQNSMGQTSLWLSVYPKQDIKLLIWVSLFFLKKGRRRNNTVSSTVFLLRNKTVSSGADLPTPKAKKRKRMRRKWRLCVVKMAGMWL